MRNVVNDRMQPVLLLCPRCGALEKTTTAMLCRSCWEAIFGGEPVMLRREG